MSYLPLFFATLEAQRRGYKLKMPKGGFEPPILAELRPERSVYTNFTTSAYISKSKNE